MLRASSSSLARLALAAVLVGGLVVTGCVGAGPRPTTGPAATSTPGPADGYPDAASALLQRGRTVAADLVAGHIDDVYARTRPDFQEVVALSEARRVLAEVVAEGPIGSREDERAVSLSEERGVYFADHAWGDDDVRFTVAFEPAGLLLSLAPVGPLPPDPRAATPAQAEIRLPFEGLWLVGEGPTPAIGNHHLAALDQRHAYDFVIWRDGATSRGDGRDNVDYWAWGQPVLAPTDANVVAVIDGVADNQPKVETNAADAAGNHVVLDLGHGEYAVLAHLQQGSVRVETGDVVTAGQVLGLTGYSGNSSEPHLHFHVQDSPQFGPGKSNGIPIRFSRYVADGVEHDLDAPSGGQFVSPAAP